MIYVHIPFCKSRCLYCDFFSSTSHSLKQEYLFSLREEISARSEEIKRARVNSIYIGGGTPSQLPVEYLQSIFHSIEQVTPIEEGAEVTIECNPDDITEEFLQGMRLTPVNRVSLGVQTMNDELLSLLHRRHKSADVPRVVAMLREAGYHNISFVEVQSDETPGTVLAQSPSHSSAPNLDKTAMIVLTIAAEETTQPSLPVTEESTDEES